MSRASIQVVVAGVGVAAFSCLAVRAALAQEYCVACTQPKAVYRCVIIDARQAEGKALSSFCVSTMMKEGGHATCDLRGGTVFDCDGPIKRIGGAAAGSADKAGEKPAADQPKQPPATVERLARDAAKSSGENLQKAGKSAGKVWTCISSLFTNC